MSFSRTSIVYKPPVSRVIPGCFLLLLLFACKHHQQASEKEIRIAKTVPSVYVLADDSNLVRHQDTVYYQQHYFTGFIFSLYPNKDTAFVHTYFNGVEEGLQRNWYDNKQLAEKRFYINGKKEGTQQGWWPDGKQKFFFTTYNNEYEGEFKEWYASGLLGKQFHYSNGHEEGSQRLWWDNGTVRANYVIRSGKKYGLIGMKTCVNPYDSVIKK